MPEKVNPPELVIDEDSRYMNLRADAKKEDTAAGQEYGIANPEEITSATIDPGDASVSGDRGDDVPGDMKGAAYDE